MTSTASVVLPASMMACSMARSWAADRLQPLGLPQAQVEDIVLCIDELVANAVLHASSAPVLTMTAGDDLRIEVADDRGDAVPQLREPDDGNPGGWGLRIVQRVSDEWGSTVVRSGGKVVWFCVRLP
jgi:anti-sigma regulatory factor (Ser/Thr protein kinase)